MGSIRPVERGRVRLAGSLLVLSAVIACAPRPPRLVPPEGGVQAVEGYASAAIAGAEASIKGKFGFVFRRPGFGRVEAVDPIGRTVFLIFFHDGRAWFVLPGRKVYAEDGAAQMMERFLGVALDPDEAIGLLSGAWPAAAEAGGWLVERDAAGRLGRGARGEASFTVHSFFPGDAVPREIFVEGPGAAGRVKVLKLNFNPAPRDGIFDTDFLRAFAPKTWEELRELLDR
jgi:hypothetical protein